MQTSSRKLRTAWSLVVLLQLPALTHGETAVQAWVQRYNGPGNTNDYAFAVAVDGSNNVIVTGASTGIGSGYDYATIKYSTGGIPLWTNRYNGPGNDKDYAEALAVDANNDVIVTGYSVGSGSGLDYATIKYSSAGEPLWTNRYNGPGNGDDAAYAVAVDGSNNVIVTGYSAGSGSGYDYATIKYSSTGLPLWTNRCNGPGNTNDYAQAVAVDGSNDVIVTGYWTGSDGKYDYATIKYSSTGVPLWTNCYNGPGNSNDRAGAEAVDSSNGVIVTGGSYGSGSSYEFATIKYSSAGVPLWTNRYNGPGTGDDQAWAVAVDGSNDVVVTGPSASSPGIYDYVTIKYSSVGVPLWTNRYNGLARMDDEPTAMAVDARQNVIVTGQTTRSTATAFDYATIKYSSAGVPLWTNYYDGPRRSVDTAHAVAVDRNGSVIVTGYSAGSGSGYDFATVKYLTVVPPPVMTGLQFTNGTFQMKMDDLLQPGTLVIEASTNLADWSRVFTNTTPTNVLFYTDPDAGNLPTRFYRAAQSL